MTKRQKTEWERNYQQGNQEVLKCKDSCRILQALQRKPLLYGEIKRLLNLKPARLECFLKELCKGLWIVPRAVPNKALVKFNELHKGIAIPDRAIPPKNCKILAIYELTKRGASVLRAHANKQLSSH